MAIPPMNVINLSSHSCSASIDILTMVQVRTSKNKCHEEEFHVCLCVCLCVSVCVSVCVRMSWASMLHELITNAKQHYVYIITSHV